MDRWWLGLRAGSAVAATVASSAASAWLLRHVAAWAFVASPFASPSVSSGSVGGSVA
jgi:hypothetical protein